MIVWPTASALYPLSFCSETHYAASGEGGVPTMAAVRGLIVILAADVAGYASLVGADEEGTLERLKEHRQDLVNPKVEEHRGRIVRATGGRLLVEFASPAEAVRCAVDLQRGMIDRNRGIAPERRIAFRVGINIGAAA